MQRQVDGLVILGHPFGQQLRCFIADGQQLDTRSAETYRLRARTLATVPCNANNQSPDRRSRSSVCPRTCSNQSVLPRESWLPKLEPEPDKANSGMGELIQIGPWSHIALWLEWFGPMFTHIPVRWPVASDGPTQASDKSLTQAPSRSFSNSSLASLAPLAANAQTSPPRRAIQFLDWPWLQLRLTRWPCRTCPL